MGKDMIILWAIFEFGLEQPDEFQPEIVDNNPS
jgi:hypothetical protein